MKPWMTAASALIAALTLAGASPALAAGGQPFEITVVPGSAVATDTVFKINVASGQTWYHCCESGNQIYTAVAEATPPPPGDYHVLSWSWFDPTGKLSYEAYRVDNKTGHTWVLNGGGAAPFTWLDINQTK